MVPVQTSLKGLVVYGYFDRKQLIRRQSDELRKEFTRLLYLKWKTIITADCEQTDEVVEDARHTTAEKQGNSSELGGTEVRRKS